MSSGFMGLHAVVLLIFVIHHGSRGRMVSAHAGYTVLHHLKPRCNWESSVSCMIRYVDTLIFVPLWEALIWVLIKAFLLHAPVPRMSLWLRVGLNYGREDKVRSLSALQASAPSRRDSVDGRSQLLMCTAGAETHTSHSVQDGLRMILMPR